MLIRSDGSYLCRLMQYALYFVYLGLVVCFSSYAGGICDLGSLDFVSSIFVIIVYN